MHRSVHPDWKAPGFHSFIHFIFAFNKKYNNCIQKYIKDNIRTIFQLNYYKIKCGKGKKVYIEAGAYKL